MCVGTTFAASGGDPQPPPPQDWPAEERMKVAAGEQDASQRRGRHVRGPDLAVTLLSCVQGSGALGSVDFAGVPGPSFAWLGAAVASGEEIPDFTL